MWGKQLSKHTNTWQDIGNFWETTRSTLVQYHKLSEMEEWQFQVFIVRILVKQIISGRTWLHIQNIWFQFQGAFFCVCHLVFITRHMQRRHFHYGEQLICSSSIFLPLQDSIERACAWQDRNMRRKRMLWHTFPPHAPAIKPQRANQKAILELHYFCHTLFFKVLEGRLVDARRSPDCMLHWNWTCTHKIKRKTHAQKTMMQLLRVWFISSAETESKLSCKLPNSSLLTGIGSLLVAISSKMMA